MMPAQGPNTGISFIGSDGVEKLVSSTNPLPTAGGGGGGAGDASAANQVTGNASLSSIDTKTPALQSGNVPVVAAALPLPLGAATETTVNNLLTRENDLVVGPTNITTQNLVPAGAATANSSVVISLAGRDTLTIQVTGTYAVSALSIQGTVDGTNWVTFGGVAQLINIATAAASATIPAAATGIYQIGVGGFAQVRVSALAAITGTATVSLRAVDGNSLVALDAAIPAGANAIGSVTVSSLPATPTGANVIGTVNVQPLAVSAYALETTTAVVLASVKASAGSLTEISVANAGATILYVKLYNKASAPVAASDTPIMTLQVPANGTSVFEFGLEGKRFTTGIAIGASGAFIKTDATAITAGSQISATYA